MKNTLFLIIAVLLVASCGENGKPTSSDNPEALPITLVSIPGGVFQIGEESGNPNDSAIPAHSVTVSSFSMSAHEITNAQYAAYLNEALASGEIEVLYGSVYRKTGSWPGSRYLEFGRNSMTENRCWVTFDAGTFSAEKGREDHPVVLVTWFGAKAFALHYVLDLPTEAEWEYACRGGMQGGHGTDNGTLSADRANYLETGIGHPVAAGSFPANPFGLYDMSGNVCECCYDWYAAYSAESGLNPSGPPSGTLRVVRGGTWNSYGDYCRSSIRNGLAPNTRDDGTGFRVVRRTGTRGY